MDISFDSSMYMHKPYSRINLPKYIGAKYISSAGSPELILKDDAAV